MVAAYLALLGLVALERAAELVISTRNARWAFAHGGLEAGRGHFPAMAALHGGFLAACACEVLLASRPFVPALGYPMLALVLVAQALRYWAIAALGPHWNVRVIVVPGAELVTRGPYRLMRHPNYLAVIVEGLALPLVHGAWLTALGFTLLNARLLVVRIRCEEQALADHCRDRDRLAQRLRFWPDLTAMWGDRADRKKEDR